MSAPARSFASLMKSIFPRPSHLPRVLSIDECKGNAAGQKYQVIITDSEAKRIMVILPARTTNGFTEGCNNKIKVVKRISFGLQF